jgi:hypothetical protein
VNTGRVASRSAGLPTEAYDSLVSLDLSKFRHGPLHYDQHRGAWRSELDE